MNKAQVPRAGIFRLLLLVVLLSLATGGIAQNNPQSDQAPQAPSAQQPTKPVPPPEEPKRDIKITPRQAEELFHSVDEILAFDSKETGLAIKREVKRKLTSRDEVVWPTSSPMPCKTRT